MSRTNLKVFRVSNRLTQAEFAARCGIGREAYLRVENGTSNGLPRFWENLRVAFDLRESELKELKKRDEENGKA